MRRIAVWTAGAIALIVGAVVLLAERGREPAVLEPGDPLPEDETVRMRWVDEETGEEDVWRVTKRRTSPDERQPAPLPEPDPAAEIHVPDESTRALHAMGLESWKRGEIREAMAQFEAAIERDPDDPLPRTQYGRLLVLAMSYTEALPHLERAAELRPDDPQVWLDLATLHEKQLALPRAWEARRRADELAGDREIRQGEMGWWVVDGNSIFP